MERVDDLQLVRRVVAGDKDAAAALAARLMCVPRFLESRLRQVSKQHYVIDQDDLVQNIYVALLRKLSEYRGEARLETWACGFARIEVARWRQRTSCRREMEFADLDNLPAPATCPQIDDEPMQNLLVHLTGRLGQVVRARHFMELSFGEIGRQMGMSESAVKSIYYRGLGCARARAQAE